MIQYLPFLLLTGFLQSGADGPSIGFAPLKGVQYSSNGNQVLGTNGDGVDGRVGNAGASNVVTGTGDGSSNSLVTRTLSSAQSTPTTSRTNSAENRLSHFGSTFMVILSTLVALL